MAGSGQHVNETQSTIKGGELLKKDITCNNIIRTMFLSPGQLFSLPEILDIRRKKLIQIANQI
jgi:hypothetical protein